MTFSDRIWSAAIKSWGALVTLAGIAISVISFFLVPEKDTVPLNVVFIGSLLAFVVLVIIIRAAYDANQDSIIRLPKVRTVIDPPEIYRDASALMVLEPSELLPYDSLVSLYYLDGGIERLIGIGKVQNIQNDKKIQIILIKHAEFSDKIKALKANNPEDLTKLIVKPSVPSSYLNGEK